MALAARIKNISIIHKNEGFVDIVDHAINEEKGLGKDSKKLEVLQKMKAEHEEEVGVKKNFLYYFNNLSNR